MNIATVKELLLDLASPWLSLSSEPAWTDIAAWLIPIIAIFLTVFASEIRRGYRE